MRDFLMLLTPVIVVLLVLTGLFSIEELKRRRGNVLVLVFLVAAIMTPSDVISMSSLAVSMYLLYEAGLLCAGLFLRP